MRQQFPVPLAAALIVFDQAMKRLLQGVNRPLIPGLVSITGVRNTGAAFGLLGGSQLALVIVSALACLLICLYLLRGKPDGLSRLGLVLVLCGALGNLIDRVLLGYVIDYIELTFVRFAVFNLADIYLTFGCALSALAVFIGKEPKHG
ncbi:MAG: signal peptidase II [Christensenellales bacterium]